MPERDTTTKPLPRKLRNDLTGHRFGRLVVQHRDLERFVAGTSTKYICICDCGTIKSVNSCGLVTGAIVSCGCYHAERAKEGPTKHGRYKDKLYTVWCAMRQRCLNPRCKVFPNYGGRGITVCAKWVDFPTFAADMGQMPTPKHTLERINNDGNYEPNNCRWASRSEQARNKRNNVFYTFKEQSLTLSDWSVLTGISLGTLRHRLKKGWTFERVLTTPVNLSYSHPARPGQMLSEFLEP